MTFRSLLDPLPAAQRAARRGRRAALLLLCLTAMLLLPDPSRAEVARWQWPTPPPHQVVTPFDAPEHDYGPGHRGIDIAVAGEGVPVRAVEAGTVRFSGEVAGRGVVSVVHADGLISTYEPVSGALAAGQAVEAGDVLGVIAGSGPAPHCAAVCLHLGARTGEDYRDPMLLLGARGPSVLLPWGGGEPGTAPAGVASSPEGPALPPTGGSGAGEAPARHGLRAFLAQ